MSLRHYLDMCEVNFLTRVELQSCISWNCEGSE